MRTVIVYFSQFGNTKRVAEAMAKVLLQAGDTRVIDIDQFAASDLSGVDLVVMGSPTYYQNLPKAFRPIFEMLPKRALQGKSVAAFDTSLKMWGPITLMTAAHRLLPKLRKLGGKKAVPPKTFLVRSSDVELEGEIDLLYDGELGRAREWAGVILKQVSKK